MLTLSPTWIQEMVARLQQNQFSVNFEANVIIFLFHRNICSLQKINIAFLKGNGAFPVKVCLQFHVVGVLPGKMMISWCYVVSQVVVWVRSHERLVQLCNSQTPGPVDPVKSNRPVYFIFQLTHR